ncbi:MAG TPA: hypothetical protein VFA70_06070 [Dehalococcoidia bacterium]|nr:hypothetical protein [Dehalococcoidia bacterium]
MHQTSAPTANRRRPTPDRWQAALRRAFAQGIEVRQLAGSGMWIATSGTDASVAYEVSQFGCSCPAAEFGDPVCKHRAAYYHLLGILELDDEPEPPTPAAPAAKLVPFPLRGRDAATAAKAVALIERMAELEGDAPAELFPAA